MKSWEQQFESKSDTAPAKRAAFFTICSNNYMPYARTLLASARCYHREVDFHFILADELIAVEGFYPAGARIIPASSLGIHDYRAFTFQYDIMELNTAVKPFAFIKLFDEGYEHIVYFDPDIEIFAPLYSVFRALDAGASFVLTPHLCSPAEGSSEPDDVTIMRAGVYNLGFLACSLQPETLRLLHWWARRTHFECINRQDLGLFVDQKFVDLIPGFSDSHCILRDTTLNVAYFNLGQRCVSQVGSNWLVDGRPLSFFHFTGIDPLNTNLLSIHTRHFRGNDLTPALRELVAHYCSKLHENGNGLIPRALYAYRQFSSGTYIHPFVREMFRERHLPWSGDPYDSYERFLHLPDVDTRGSRSFVVTNLMKHIWERHPFLRHTFDLNNPLHVEGYVRWFVEHAQSHWRLDHRLIEPSVVRAERNRPDPLPPFVSTEMDRPDVTVVGYMKMTGGVGEVGRLTLRALAQTQLAVSGYDVSLGLSSDRRAEDNYDRELSSRVDGRVQIYNINADQLPHVMDEAAPLTRSDAYRITIPFWELAEFPSAWCAAFDKVEEIWAPTRFIQTALFRKTKKTIIHIPIALPFAAPAGFGREYFSLPNKKFLFFISFDFLSFQKRKNPRGAYRAFRRAFSGAGSQDVCLVVKTLNARHAPEEFLALQEEVTGCSDVIFIDKRLTRAETLGLIDASNCVISLHRSEGLGLLVAEAMMLGKPVVATDYSATTELLTPARGFPVDYRLVSVGEGDYPFAAGQWAEPDEAHAAWQLRRVYSEYDAAMLKARRARIELQESHSIDRVAQLQFNRLREIGLVPNTVPSIDSTPLFEGAYIPNAIS